MVSGFRKCLKTHLRFFSFPNLRKRPKTKNKPGKLKSKLSLRFGIKFSRSLRFGMAKCYWELMPNQICKHFSRWRTAKLNRTLIFCQDEQERQNLILQTRKLLTISSRITRLGRKDNNWVASFNPLKIENKLFSTHPIEESVKVSWKREIERK